MDISLEVERKFGHRSKKVAEYLGQLWTIAQGDYHPAKAKAACVSDAWFQFPVGTTPSPIEGDTLGDAFLRRAIANLDQPIVNDMDYGVMTYRRVLNIVRLLANQFRLLPGKHVGIMMPASVAADVTFFSLHMANKVPVMLNWTIGPNFLNHSADQTSLAHVVTSQGLAKRIGSQIPNVQYVFIDECVSRINKLSAITRASSTYLRPERDLKRYLPPDPDDTAVFLFTSGSESTPKTVPLTHRNLLVNLRDGIAGLELTNHDSILGFLPPFHSFGLYANTLIPLLGGFRCTRFPDPTDMHGLRQTVSDYQPSFLFTTPTLLERLLSISLSKEMKSVRRFVTGAEKCPEGVFELCEQKAPDAIVLEGYGITECSPAISLNTTHARKRGTIGKPLANVDARVVDVDTEEPLPSNATGMLVVSGPSIFPGYYRFDGPSPFIEAQGKRWYKTGDLASIDDDGFIQFRGRLKRFLKAGGEMISLPALEEPFKSLFPATEHGPRIAVEGVEDDGVRRIVLFTTEDLSLSQASQILLDAGFRGVMRLDEVRRVDSIPMLGTGKVDYKQLRLEVTQ